MGKLRSGFPWFYAHCKRRHIFATETVNQPQIAVARTLRLHFEVARTDDFKAIYHVAGLWFVHQGRHVAIQQASEFLQR